MTSRQMPPPQLIFPVVAAPPPAPSIDHLPGTSRILTPVTAGISVSFSLLFFLTFFCRKVSRKRTAPADSKPPHRFTYSVLRRATSSFSDANRVGRGGSGTVYRGTLKGGKEVAVKVVDSGSLQGEMEFQNELLIAGKVDSDMIVSVQGFCSDRKRRRMLLVYDLMHNGNLQEALLNQKCPELMHWKKRFAISMNIAKGLKYLHFDCSPPVIHGDIKASNILLDQNFTAKIADFGLASLKTDDLRDVTVDINGESEAKKKEELELTNGGIAGDDRSAIEGTKSVDLSPEKFVTIPITGSSPENSVRVGVVEASPEAVLSQASPGGNLEEASPRNLEKTSVSEANFDKASVESGKNWWWRQKNEGNELRNVKDYVSEWIALDVQNKPPNRDRMESSSSSITGAKSNRKKTRQDRRRLEWWMSLDEDKIPKKEKRRPPREWWKEEYCEELARKNKKKKKKEGQTSTIDDNNEETWWPRDEDLYTTKKKRSSRRGSRSSIDWWLDGLSRRSNSHDSATSVCSTPSMRGTVCYVAPEYGGGGRLSEKCDVYSFGVLLLVLISGRRPLQVSSSPTSDFKRANLISWARHLARTGKLLELVDQSVQNLDRAQALLCIMVALICLQKSPIRRPTMQEVVGMLSGELDPPQLPFELSPSPPSRVPLKTRKNSR